MISFSLTLFYISSSLVPLLVFHFLSYLDFATINAQYSCSLICFSCRSFISSSSFSSSFIFSFSAFSPSLLPLSYFFSSHFSSSSFPIRLLPFTFLYYSPLLSSPYYYSRLNLPSISPTFYSLLLSYPDLSRSLSW